MIEFNESTGLYFYSSLLQADAAMISIVGLFLIYWIQSLENKISSVMNSLTSQKIDRIDNINNFFSSDIKGQQEFFNSISGQTAPLPYYQKAISFKKKIVEIKASIKTPTILLTAGIGITALLLLSSNSLHVYHPKYELSFAIFTLFYHFLILFFVVRIILLAVSDN